MYKFLYISLICGLLAGAGVFLNIPPYPSLIFPMVVAFLGIVCTIVTFPEKDVKITLKLGGVLINVMPLLGALTQINM
ncbi:hypothetical protein [Staphylococcus arlettae]|uniref:hypothetical protein n=1 Tax=Staphylococcus arlettae TaxID=29378 RepID=UPI001EDF5419|nr:hypothetical protein [Staphylococcus arlettae]MCP8713458.1 hypothetical protein [Staphylococcus arlettae]MDN0187531.1 hypothetical protein [Staphylococcus arlettae]